MAADRARPSRKVGSAHPVWSSVIATSLAIGLGTLVAGGCSAVDDSYSDSVGSSGSPLESMADYGAAAPAPAEIMTEGGSVIGAEAVARQLVFTGAMRALVGDIAAASEAITAWVDDRGGFVERSSTSAFGGRPSMHLVLRVPSADYEALREHVREVAIEVEGDESQRDDVTSQHTDYRARLDALRLAETELRELLAAQDEQGGDLETVLAIHRELRTLRAEIDSLQAQLDGLEEQVALSTLSVELYSESMGALDSRTWRIGAVFAGARRDLVRNLQVFSEGFVYFVVAVVPLLLAWTAALAAALWIAVTIARRLGLRRRGRGRGGAGGGGGGGLEKGKSRPQPNAPSDSESRGEPPTPTT